MDHASLFQVILLLAQGALTVVVLLIGAILNHILKEIRDLRAKNEIFAGDVRTLERELLPKSEFRRHEDFVTKERHNMKERIGVLEIRTGAWAPPKQ